MLVGFKAKNHPQQPKNSDVDDRALPQDAFDVLDKRFKFTVDVAASAQNAKVSRYYTEAEDGLFQDWNGERVYCNPPYSSIYPWVKKAWNSTNAGLVVMLLPANRTEQTWWQELVEPYRDRIDTPLRVEFLKGRQRFLKKQQDYIQPNERPPFGVCLCIWRPNGFTPHFEKRLFD